jgi:hypothetical protein
VSSETNVERCDACGERYEARLGRDGLCFACATHLGCACADEPEPSPRVTPAASDDSEA